MTEMMSSSQQSASSLLMLAAVPKVMHLTGPRRLGARACSSYRYIMASSDATPPVASVCRYVKVPNITYKGQNLYRAIIFLGFPSNCYTVLLHWNRTAV